MATIKDLKYIDENGDLVEYDSNIIITYDDDTTEDLQDLLIRIDSNTESIKSDVTTIKDDVSTLKSDATALKSDVSTIKDDVSTTKDNILTIKDGTNEITLTDSDGNETAIKIADALSNITNTINEISSNTNGTEIENIWSEVEGMTKAIQQLVNTVSAVFGGGKLHGTGAIYETLGTDVDPNTNTVFESNITEVLSMLSDSFTSTNKYYYTIEVKTLDNNVTYSITINGAIYSINSDDNATKQEIYTALATSINNDDESIVTATNNAVLSLSTKNPLHNISVTVSENLSMSTQSTIDFGDAINSLRDTLKDQMEGSRDLIARIMVGQDESNIMMDNGKYRNILDSLTSSTTTGISDAIRELSLNQEYQQALMQITQGKTSPEILEQMNIMYPNLSKAKKVILSDFLAKLKNNGRI